jgi:hypothetical protein
MAKKTPATKTPSRSAPKPTPRELDNSELDKATGAGSGRNPTTWRPTGG